MTTSISTANFSQLLQEFITLIQLLQAHFDSLMGLEEFPAITALSATIKLTIHINIIIDAIIATQYMVLSKQEYINICELIICAHTMANYLIAKRQSPLWLRQHASRSQQLMKEFEDLLLRVPQ